MLRAAAMISALAVLSACGDPLGDLPRISDVDIVESDPAAQALPTDQEIAREGFFGTAAATGDAMGVRNVPAAVTVPPRRGGFLSTLRRVLPGAQPAAERTDPVAAALAANGAVAEDAVDAAPSQEVAPRDPAPEDVQVAALSPEPDLAPELRARPARGGFLSRLTGSAPRAKPSQSALADVEYGTLLPHGVVARSCASKRQPLGRKVEAATASGYKLYDSNPRISGPRTFYITGFDDGCPRQLTASNVLFGDPSLYEILHFGPGGENLPVAETDAAYEKVKARVCGARKGRPCGANMRKLERNTFFVNSYSRPNDNTSWSEILIHDGEVMATSMKSSG